MRDRNIKGPDLLDVEKYPKITFKSTAVIKITPSAYKITGDLTLHGITRPIVLDAVVRMGMGMNQKPAAGFRVSGTILRRDFGITQYPAAMLGDEIRLDADGEFASDNRQ